MDVVWSLPKRVAFRFGFIAGLVFVYPFPIGLLPGTGWLGEILNQPRQALVLWFAEAVLGLPRPAIEHTGSGDTLYAWVAFLVTLLLAALGTAVWSIVDRRRRAYPRLAAGALTMLRYVLAMTMFAYGFAKLVNSQFPFPNASRLDGSIGELSPMGLAWTFMGYSTPYTMFAGACEVLGAALVLFRRTTLLGALVIIAVLTNVVMVNLCYDVPVKLYSMELLVIALVIAAPHVRRILAAVLGYATPELPPRPRLSARAERARVVAKLAMVLAFGLHIRDDLAAAAPYRDLPDPLGGLWEVETWIADGIERPPLTVDATRWRALAVNPLWGTIRTMTDERTDVNLAVDELAHTLAISRGATVTTWRYTQPDPRHLVLDGSWAGYGVRATFVRKPEPLLVTRGFHWIQEAPLER